MKEEITSQKKTIQGQKIKKLTAKDKRPLLLYFTDSKEVFAGWAIYFIFSP